MKKCPACGDAVDLTPAMTRQGVEIDTCPRCGGIWLDGDEVYHFTKLPTYLRAKINEALEKQKPTSRKSPVTGQPMVELPLFDSGVMIDYCPQTRGIWLDKGEIEKLPVEKCRIDIDRGVVEEVEEPQTQTAEAITPSTQRRPFGELLPLPNLAFSSGMVLFGMYALLTVVLITASYFAGLTPLMALVIGLVFATIQFLLGPFLMDLSLRFLYKIQWVELTALPNHLSVFLQKVCQEKNIKVPRMGIILDGAPNAFTYGHHPNNARIVVTRGLLDLLTEEESETVVAHEVGHVVHWDMLVMTIVQLVPLVLYYIYRTLIRMRSGGREDKSAPARYAIAIGAYILYIISEYIVLWFSRIREYYADRFAGEVTGKPERLASALVKIGYGLAGESASDAKTQKRSDVMRGVEPLGIFNAKEASRMAVTSYSSPKKMGGEINKQALKDVAKWDLWNPWAAYYELHSTHPLIAKRIKYLSNQAQHMGRPPYVEFNERQPESYWDEFFVDVFIHLLPMITIIGGFLFFGYRAAFDSSFSPSNLGAFFGPLLLLFGLAQLINVLYSYSGRDFAPFNVKALLKKIKVSAVRPVPCTIRGTIIGRGVPGLIYSEDFVLQDETGMIFLDYQQPLGIINFFFGLLRAKQYQNQEAEIVGWYRRAPIPYIEIKHLSAGGRKSTCYSYHAKLFFAIAIVLIGLVVALSAFG